MAIGDVISDVGADNTLLDFQPAAGVEVYISAVGNDGGSGNIGLYDGTVLSDLGSYTPLNGSMKIFINNSVYLRIAAQGAGAAGSYCGIQTK